MKLKMKPRRKSQAKTVAAARKRMTRLAPTTKTLSFLQDYWKVLGGPDIAEADLKALQEFYTLRDEDKVPAAQKVIQQAVIDASAPPDARIPLAIEVGENLLPGYATLDAIHRAEITNLIRDISMYLRDSSRKRPFNCLMLAAPGAGKSHFIKQLTEKMKAERVQSVTFNMATMQSHDDMAQPVDELRNLKVNDQFPLLFLDEFDSDPARYSSLLPLLWEGELHIGHRDLKLGKAVIVLAGSNPDLPKIMDQSAKMQQGTDSQNEALRGAGKLVDLLSRINGGIINIPDLDLRSEKRDRRVDKVCVAISLLKARFGKDLAQVPRSLLRFIAHTNFRYGVRSIAHLLDIIDSKAFRNHALKGSTLRLPLTSKQVLQESSLKLHLLDKNEAFGVVNRWKEFDKDRAVVNLDLPRGLTLFLRRLPRPSARRRHASHKG
jgi:hypothetical protein